MSSKITDKKERDRQVNLQYRETHKEKIAEDERLNKEKIKNYFEKYHQARYEKIFKEFINSSKEKL